MRVESLFQQLDLLLELRPAAKRAMIIEARKQPEWKVLRSIPFLGDVRVAKILAIMATPWRFRTKRQAWPYVGPAVVTRPRVRTRSSPATLFVVSGARRSRAVSIATITAAEVCLQRCSECGFTLKDFYDACVARGVREELAEVTLTRKIVTIALRLWKTGELWDPGKLKNLTTK